MRSGHYPPDRYGRVLPRVSRLSRVISWKTWNLDGRGFTVAARSRLGFFLNRYPPVSGICRAPTWNVNPPRTVRGRGRRAHNKIRLIARTPIDLDRAQLGQVDIEHEALSAAW